MVSNYYLFFIFFILYSFFSSSITSTRDHIENKAIRACLVPSLPSSILPVNYLYTNIFIYDFLIFLHDSLQAYSGILMLSFASTLVCLCMLAGLLLTCFYSMAKYTYLLTYSREELLIHFFASLFLTPCYGPLVFSYPLTPSEYL